MIQASAMIAKFQQSLAEKWGYIYGKSHDKWTEAKQAACINHYHALIRRLSAAQADPAAWTERYCDAHPDGIILLNETGCGIIPLDPAERRLRELTGICGCIIAARAETVIRVTCGIPAALRGDLL